MLSKKGFKKVIYSEWIAKQQKKASVKPKISPNLIEKRKERELLKKAKKAEKRYKESLPKKLTEI